MSTGGALADIVELILSDHRRIRRLQEALRPAACRCDSEPSWALPRTWDRLAGLIGLHIRAEEEVCWLPMSATAPEIRPHIRDMTMTGEHMREAIAESRLAPTGTQPWWLAVNDALAHCNARLDCVEHDILPRFVHLADGAVRDRLGCQWLAFQATHGREYT